MAVVMVVDAEEGIEEVAVAAEDVVESLREEELLRDLVRERLAEERLGSVVIAVVVVVAVAEMTEEVSETRLVDINDSCSSRAPPPSFMEDGFAVAKCAAVTRLAFLNSLIVNCIARSLGLKSNMVISSGCRCFNLNLGKSWDGIFPGPPEDEVMAVL
jgi:hypothetical protein